jgi:hypothetical protein
MYAPEARIAAVSDLAKSREALPDSTAEILEREERGGIAKTRGQQE